MPDQPSAPPHCPSCRDTGHVCENHPERWWGGLCCDTAALRGAYCEHGACGCGAGMPCPACCSPIPQDGARQIGEAFVPDRERVTHA
jgi:hypothetical protein